MQHALQLTPEWRSIRYWMDILFLMILIPVISTVSILADLELEGRTIVWWPAAIPICVYWFRGANRWPGVLLGYLVHYYLTYPTENFFLIDYAWQLSVVNAFEALLILWWINKLNVRAPFQKWRDTRIFILLGLLPIGVLTSIIAHAFLWFKGVEITLMGFYWWYAGNVVAALILVPFIMVFGRPRPLLKVRTHPGIWFLGVLLAFVLAIVSYFPNSLLTLDQQCIVSGLFVPLYLVFAYVLGTIGVVSILMIGGIISNLSYSQGIGVCYLDGVISLEILWIFMITLPVCFLFLASYLDHRKELQEKSQQRDS